MGFESVTKIFPTGVKMAFNGKGFTRRGYNIGEKNFVDNVEKLPPYSTIFIGNKFYKNVTKF